MKKNILKPTKFKYKKRVDDSIIRTYWLLNFLSIFALALNLICIIYFYFIMYKFEHDKIWNMLSIQHELTYAIEKPLHYYIEADIIIVSVASGILYLLILILFRNSHSGTSSPTTESIQSKIEALLQQYLNKKISLESEIDDLNIVLKQETIRFVPLSSVDPETIDIVTNISQIGGPL